MKIRRIKKKHCKKFHKIPLAPCPEVRAFYIEAAMQADDVAVPVAWDRLADGTLVYLVEVRSVEIPEKTLEYVNSAKYRWFKAEDLQVVVE